MEKRFMPRRLHYPIPLIWNLTAPQFVTMAVSFAIFAVFIVTAGSISQLIFGIVGAGASVGAEFLVFMILRGTERALLKHCVSKIKYGLKVPPRYAGR